MSLRNWSSFTAHCTTARNGLSSPISITKITAWRTALRSSKADSETGNAPCRDWFLMRVSHCFGRRAYDEEPAVRREHFRSDHLYVCRLTLVRNRVSCLLDAGAQS